MNVAVLPPDVAELNRSFERKAPQQIIASALKLFPRRVALVSSFGTESVVLLALAAEIDRSISVIFLNTGWLFPETLEYRNRIVERLKLSDVRSVEPLPTALVRHDPDNSLWSHDADRCCEIRKVDPLAEALAPFGAWISGRKRYQGTSRADVPAVEEDGDRLKFNPLAFATREDVTEFFASRALPRHPLEAKGFASIGCVPCTSATGAGEDMRAGRWRGQSKTECGIHRNKTNK